jgi:hypothetical protein
MTEMDGNRFDSLTRRLAETPSRRQFLSALAGGAVAGLLGQPVAADGCKRNGKACKKNGQCCSGNCVGGTGGSTSGSGGTCKPKPPVCTPDLQPCDISNPAACCSQCCMLSADGVSYVCCNF